MRVLCYVVAVLAALATVIFFTIAIWTSDSRWAGTSFVGLVVSGSLFATAPELPKHVPHNQRCNGC